MRRTVTAARCVALAIAMVMAVYFATAGVVRSDNPFLIPDALVVVLLLTAALLPQRVAVPALIFAFGWDAAVFTTSLSNHAVNGRFAEKLDHFALILPSVVMAVLLARGASKHPYAAGHTEPGRPDERTADRSPV